MERRLIATNARNLLVGAGAYYLSWWVANPLSIGFDKLIKLNKGITVNGEFAGDFLIPIVITLPHVLVAALVGAFVAWIVDSDRPIGWTLVPTFLFALGVFHLAHWARPPRLSERVGDIIRVLLPPVACIAAGIVVAKRRATLHISTPG